MAGSTRWLRRFLVIEGASGSTIFDATTGTGGATGGGLAASEAHEFIDALASEGRTLATAGDGFGDDVVEVVEHDLVIGRDEG